MNSGYNIIGCQLEKPGDAISGSISSALNQLSDVSLTDGEEVKANFDCFYKTVKARAALHQQIILFSKTMKTLTELKNKQNVAAYHQDREEQVQHKIAHTSISSEDRPGVSIGTSTPAGKSDSPATPGELNDGASAVTTESPLTSPTAAENPFVKHLAEVTKAASKFMKEINTLCFQGTPLEREEAMQPLYIEVEYKEVSAMLQQKLHRQMVDSGAKHRLAESQLEGVTKEVSVEEVKSCVDEFKNVLKTHRQFLATKKVDVEAEKYSEVVPAMRAKGFAMPAVTYGDFGKMTYSSAHKTCFITIIDEFNSLQNKMTNTASFANRATLTGKELIKMNRTFVDFQRAVTFLDESYLRVTSNNTTSNQGGNS